MENELSNNEASSGTSALNAGLGVMPTDEAQLANAMEMFARMVEKYVRVCRAMKQECRDADELLKLLRLDPDTYRTDCGYINLPKVRAALANPDDYPMMPSDLDRTNLAILRDSAKDVIAWCDKTGSGDSLYCITRLRHVIASTETPNV